MSFSYRNKGDTHVSVGSANKPLPKRPPLKQLPVEKNAQKPEMLSDHPVKLTRSASTDTSARENARKLAEVKKKKEAAARVQAAHEAKAQADADAAAAAKIAATAVEKRELAQANAEALKKLQALSPDAPNTSPIRVFTRKEAEAAQKNLNATFESLETPRWGQKPSKYVPQVKNISREELNAIFEEDGDGSEIDTALHVRSSPVNVAENKAEVDGLTGVAPKTSEYDIYKELLRQYFLAKDPRDPIYLDMSIQRFAIPPTDEQSLQARLLAACEYAGADPVLSEANIRNDTRELLKICLTSSAIVQGRLSERQWTQGDQQNFLKGFFEYWVVSRGEEPLCREQLKQLGQFPDDLQGESLLAWTVGQIERKVHAHRVLAVGGRRVMPARRPLAAITQGKEQPIALARHPRAGRDPVFSHLSDDLMRLYYASLTSNAAALVSLNAGVFHGPLKPSPADVSTVVIEEIKNTVGSPDQDLVELLLAGVHVSSEGYVTGSNGWQLVKTTVDEEFGASPRKVIADLCAANGNDRFYGVNAEKLLPGTPLSFKNQNISEERVPVIVCTTPEKTEPPGAPLPRTPGVLDLSREGRGENQDSTLASNAVDKKAEEVEYEATDARSKTPPARPQDSESPKLLIKSEVLSGQNGSPDVETSLDHKDLDTPVISMQASVSVITPRSSFDGDEKDLQTIPLTPMHCPVIETKLDATLGVNTSNLSQTYVLVDRQPSSSPAPQDQTSWWSGLSTAKKVGVVVGVALAALVVTAAAVAIAVTVDPEILPAVVHAGIAVQNFVVSNETIIVNASILLAALAAVITGVVLMACCRCREQDREREAARNVISVRDTEQAMAATAQHQAPTL